MLTMSALGRSRKKSPKDSDKENNVPLKTVQIDVGGTVYKVSRSLIEAFPKTFLYQMVTKTWSVDNKAPIFIDRNGDRFQYILDLMRDNEVHLPLSISKAAILRDLEYFGFENFNAYDIHDGFASAQAATQIAKCEALYQKELELCHRTVRKFQQKVTLLNVAHSCFLSYTKTANLTELYLGDYSLNLMTLKDDINAAFENLNKELFDECLAIHGLKYVSHRAVDLRSHHSIWYYSDSAAKRQE
jgi:BTB/POZ domain